LSQAGEKFGVMKLISLLLAPFKKLIDIIAAQAQDLFCFRLVKLQFHKKSQLLTLILYQIS